MNTTAAQIPNHLVWAILATLFCCLPGGIVSIVYAAQVNGKIAAGDLAGARDSSDRRRSGPCGRPLPASSSPCCTSCW